MVRLVPAVTVPRLQGNAVVQSPVFETKVRPAGVGSVTVTAAAFEGPLFVTTMVKTTFWPAVIRAGPVLVTPTSADGVTVVLACRVNDGCDPVPSGSRVAVFVTVPVVAALTLTLNCTVAAWPALT